MNKIIITGRLGRDPEMKVANSGTELTNFTVAVDRRTRKGEEKKTDWINCTAFGKTAAFVNQYFQKGDGVVVIGRMESNTSESNGERRTWWGVTVEEVEFPVSSSKHAEREVVNTANQTDPVATETDEDLPF